MAQAAELNKEQARALFQEALALVAAADYATALEKLQRVASYKRTPQVEFYIAVCHENMGKLVMALGEYRIAMADASTAAVTDVVSEAAAAIEKLELVYSGKKIKITLSAGVSSFAQCINKFDRDKKDNRCIKRMIKMADIALYYAKMSKCCSCKHIPGADMEIKGNKCPNCGKETMSDRNRVEIYNNQMEPFNK